MRTLFRVGRYRNEVFPFFFPHTPDKATHDLNSKLGIAMGRGMMITFLDFI
jgi:hypothetical protein